MTVDAAIALGRTGKKVFPCIENGKIPAIGGWQQRATSDEAEIRKMWTAVDPVLGTTYIKNYNIGVSTKGLLVLDVDNKGQKRGSEALAELDIIHGIPATYMVETPTGGYHLYFHPASAVANSASKIAAGLDVRGDGGYVMGPGSIIDGKAYTVKHHGAIAQAPEWLERTAGKPVEREAGKQIVEVLDTKPAVERATAYLEAAEPAIEGQGGDAHTFKVAAKVKDFGISELTCLQLMFDHWNDRCAPTWPWESLANKVSNAYHYGKKPIGASSAQADFEKVDAPAANERPKLYRRKYGDIRPRLKETALVQKLLGENAMSVVYGESNTGKTFFAMAVAHAIAAGRDFAQRKVAQGPVVYVAAEAGVSAENRIAALREKFGSERIPLDLVPCPVDLLRGDGDTKPLIELIKEAEADHGAKVRMVVIDTLSRAMSGGNENSPDDMGALVKHLDAIRVATGAHVLVVHHSGKDKAKGARGHSLLRAATDTEIEIDNGVASVTKQRDMEFGEPIPFDLEVVALGETPDGEDVTSCVCVPVLASAVEDFGCSPARANLLIDALKEAVASKNGRPVTWNYWREFCIRYIEIGVSEGKNGDEWPRPRNSLNKALRDARDSRGLKSRVKKVGADQWVMA